MVHTDCPRRTAHECRDAVSGPPLERSDAQLHEPRRSDHDSLPAPLIPPAFAAIAVDAASHAGLQFAPDICIVNFYTEASRIGCAPGRGREPGDARGRSADRFGVAGRHWLRFVIGGVTRR